MPFAGEVVHFALLAPLTNQMTGSWSFGRKIAGVAALAVAKVNSDKSLLTGRVLEYSLADSGCSAQQALNAMGELLAGESRVDAVIGPGCSAGALLFDCVALRFLAPGFLPLCIWPLPRRHLALHHLTVGVPAFFLTASSSASLPLVTSCSTSCRHINPTPWLLVCLPSFLLHCGIPALSS